MNAKVIVPFKRINPKSRLSGYLDEEEREELAICMLKDVLSSLSSAGFSDVNLLVESEKSIPEEFENVNVVCDSRELSVSINEFTSKPPCLVVMSDLPLLTPELLKSFVKLKGDVILTPGRRCGTNMLFTRVPFKTSYHYGSFLKHITIGKLSGIKVNIFDSFFASIDVDTPEDLLEVMIHGTDTETGKFLKRIGFRVCLAKNPMLIRVYR